MIIEMWKLACIVYQLQFDIETLKREIQSIQKWGFRCQVEHETNNTPHIVTLTASG